MVFPSYIFSYFAGSLQNFLLLGTTNKKRFSFCSESLWQFHILSGFHLIYFTPFTQSICVLILILWFSSLVWRKSCMPLPHSNCCCCCCFRIRFVFVWFLHRCINSWWPQNGVLIKQIFDIVPNKFTRRKHKNETKIIICQRCKRCNCKRRS